MPFHVFLSHSSTDKPAVEELARRLKKEEGIQFGWTNGTDSERSLATSHRSGLGTGAASRVHEPQRPGGDYANQGQYAKAVPLYEQALAIREKGAEPGALLEAAVLE
jgi:hypothetical protein